MAIFLPPQNSPIRELFDVSHLAQMVQEKSYLSYADAKASAKAMIGGAVKGATFVVLSASGELLLVQFGPKLGRKIVWNFSTGE